MRGHGEGRWGCQKQGTPKWGVAAPLLVRWHAWDILALTARLPDTSWYSWHGKVAEEGYRCKPGRTAVFSVRTVAATDLLLNSPGQFIRNREPHPHAAACERMRTSSEHGKGGGGRWPYLSHRGPEVYIQHGPQRR